MKPALADPVTETDLLIVGAGPAGMAAAVTARQFGLDVLLIDDQPAPGGQIWRGVEMVAATARGALLGKAYADGLESVAALRASGAAYEPGAQLWQLERDDPETSGSERPGFRAFLTQGGKARMVRAKTVVLATGAQERPVPFPGWTLPGVMTVGAAQILLKNAGQIPEKPVWVVGCGPLPLLYMTQLLAAGGTIAGYLDTTPRGRFWKALPHLPRALRKLGDLVKGLAWMLALWRAGVRIVRHVSHVEAQGELGELSLSFCQFGGEFVTVQAELVLVHEGVVPNIHPVRAFGCATMWSPAQDCLVPVLDEWGESSVPCIFVSGDGAGIGGAKAAELRGRIAALRIAEMLTGISKTELHTRARPLRKALQSELSARPFLDTMFSPRPQVFDPPDETIICRCEEVTARDIRAHATIGQPGPTQMKAFTRAGMGPCQGRQCGYPVAHVVAKAQGRPVSEVGFFHIRPPLKPVTLGELAALDLPHPPTKEPAI